MKRQKQQERTTLSHLQGRAVDQLVLADVVLLEEKRHGSVDGPATCEAGRSRRRRRRAGAQSGRGATE